MGCDGSFLIFDAVLIGYRYYKLAGLQFSKVSTFRKLYNLLIDYIRYRKKASSIMKKFTDSIGCWLAHPLFGHQFECSYLPGPLGHVHLF